jgi:hypothetical protein
MSIHAVKIVGAVAGLLISVAPLFGQFSSNAPAALEVETLRFSPDVAEVVKMAQSGKSQEEMITQVKTCPRLYNLSATDAVNLDKFKVPPQVVMAMVEHDRVLATQDLSAHPVATETTGTTPRLTTPAQAGSPVADKAAKSVKPTPDSSVSRPKGTPPAPARKPKKTWTSSVIVEQAPPAPKLELIPKEPGSEYIWIRGHWAWTGTWTWEEGYWVQRPAPDIQWMDGVWARHGKGWIWMPGHWR